MKTIYVNWDKGKVKLTWMSDKEVPDKDLITSVHGFCFYNERLLLVKLSNRGWDIPGGHVELNETAEESFKREAMEEGYVEGKCHYLGYIEISHEENTNWQADSPYPKVGYQLLYRMDIKQLHHFSSEHESTERIFIHPMEITDYHRDWHEILECVLDEALIKLHEPN